MAFGTGAVTIHSWASAPALKNTYLCIMLRFLVSYLFPIPATKAAHSAFVQLDPVLFCIFSFPKRKGVSVKKNLLDLNLQD